MALITEVCWRSDKRTMQRQARTRARVRRVGPGTSFLILEFLDRDLAKEAVNAAAQAVGSLLYGLRGR